jgi:hypothetical protein
MPHRFEEFPAFLLTDMRFCGPERVPAGGGGLAVLSWIISQIRVCGVDSGFWFDETSDHGAG